MKTAVIHIYLEDQCVRIGCGWRTVNMTFGRKWLRVEERAIGRRGKLPVSMLPGLRYREIEVRKRRRYFNAEITTGARPPPPISRIAR